jgi:DNA invertase Pin-like site-specific DNA recombinase
MYSSAICHSRRSLYSRSSRSCRRSYTEQYLDSTGIFKDAVISIMATIAKQENLRRSERIMAGLARAKRNGSRLGRPRVSNAKASRTTLWRRANRE